MRVLLVLVLLLLVPQLAAAKVYMCVDQATGKTSFSDKGCETKATQEEVRVPPSNVVSGTNTAEKATPKAWASDRDTRKTGRDYTAEQRSAAESARRGANLLADGT